MCIRDRPNILSADGAPSDVHCGGAGGRELPVQVSGFRNLEIFSKRDAEIVLNVRNFSIYAGNTGSGELLLSGLTEPLVTWTQARHVIGFSISCSG